MVPLIEQLERDGSNVARRKCKAIRRILIGNDIILRLLNEGGYRKFPEEINAKNFPTVGEPKLDGAQLDRYDRNMLSDDICCELDNRFRRSATLAETLLYGIRNPGDQCENRIVSLQSWWKNPKKGDGYLVVAVLGCYESVGGFLSGSCQQNTVELEPYNTRWGANCRFLSLPKQIS
ncbi:MAG: hypothetical protein V1716_02455 [Candidatus Uhrbacteria bacterium]